ncbi:MAG TPA: LysR family transcriptional regulator [Longimicrobium sp.]|jgi:DNA-binding transcriptional LysR family regulator|uniref:LysR family transcriptional regulator n=1 Tax=Longimicrobium sp. TaxID=2029185 RepID=UPI002EDAD217
MKPELLERIELRHLRYFIAVAEELHFGRAAVRLGMAQPPLSQQIARLERLVGHALFERRPRVVLTEAGRVLLTASRRLLLQVEQGVDAARRAGSGEGGVLTVGFAASTMLTVLPGVLRDYRDRHPAVDLRLREMSTAAQADALKAGLIDVGFMREPAADAAIRAEPAVREPFVAALPPGHALAGHATLPLERLADEPFVLFPRRVAPTLYDQVIVLCRAAGFHPRQVQEAQEWLTIVGLVDAGLGVSLVPASFQRLRWGGVAYVVLEGSGGQTTIALCTRREEPSPTLAGLLELTRERLPLLRGAGPAAS